MPQAIMDTGKLAIWVSTYIVLIAYSARRKSEESDDVLVLCRILHWFIRRPTKSARAG